MRIDSLRRMICDKGGSVDDAKVVESGQAGDIDAFSKLVEKCQL